MWKIPHEIAQDPNTKLREYVLDQLRDPKEFLNRLDELYRTTNVVLDTIKFKDGRIFERHSQTLFGTGSKAIRVWSFRDITTQRRTEEERERQKVELELYASLLRHDLVNDIQNLMHQCEILEMEYTKKARKSSPAVESIYAILERMKRLLDAFSEPTSEMEHDLVTLLIKLANQAEEMHSGLTVTVNMKNGDEQVPVTAGRLLTMCFENLIRNSIQHVGKQAQIQMTVSVDDNKANVIFSDNGPGIPDEMQSKLFQKGISSKGSGLGLYLTREVLKAYGGSIELIKSENGGASFLIEIPLRI
jgi:signal transduction histidine kinase